MRTNRKGLAEHAFPFTLAAGLALMTSSSGLAAVIASPCVWESMLLWLRLTVGVAWFLFIWTLLTFFSLVRLTFDYWELKGVYLDAKQIKKIAMGRKNRIAMSKSLRPASWHLSARASGLIAGAVNQAIVFAKEWVLERKSELAGATAAARRSGEPCPRKRLPSESAD